jgi:hypothetical protein
VSHTRVAGSGNRQCTVALRLHHVYAIRFKGIQNRLDCAFGDNKQTTFAITQSFMQIWHYDIELLNAIAIKESHMIAEPKLFNRVQHGQKPWQISTLRFNLLGLSLKP